MLEESLSTYFEMVEKTNQVITPEEEAELFRQYKETGSRRTAEKILRANLRLGVSIALNYKWYSIPIDDLIQQANIGIWKAIDRFKPEYGNRFASYASWVARTEIRRYISKTIPPFKMLSKYRHTNLFNTLSSTWQMAKLLREAKGDQESLNLLLRRKTNCSEKEVRLYREMLGVSFLSLEKKTSAFTSNEDSLYDTLENIESPIPENQLLESEYNDHLEFLIQSTVQNIEDERLRFILEKRWLVEDGNEIPTLRELGEELGVSRERVRQLENRALSIIKETLEQGLLALSEPLTTQTAI